ncbi:MAG: HAD family phosphatase [Thermoplasma acidophilum]|nr:HAD family phosphatase [Thermoplasma acidophilum]
MISTDMPIKLIAFDMDGVILKNRNSWEKALAGIYGAGGNRNYAFQSISRHGKKFHVPPGLDLRSYIENSFDVKDITYDFHLMADFLSYTGIKSVIISAGVINYARKLSEIYRLDDYVANGVVDYRGELKFIRHVDPARKDLNLDLYLKKFGLKKSEAISIGDSLADYSMRKSSAFFIAFNPSDARLSALADATSYNFSGVIRIVKAISNITSRARFGAPISD